MLKVIYKGETYLTEIEMSEYKKLKNDDIVCIVDNEFNQNVIYKYEIESIEEIKFVA